ncbi:beta-glucosidase [Edaphobacter bradus]|uniref:beta-glucosidase n=1 Tax=Edaphobacter bradus TaxID=2259016 RepID=UPI0021DFDFC4|nr:glycoside hydrolase family 3 C-terminal domain-containing protein [Edaphobacter bradus]
MGMGRIGVGLRRWVASVGCVAVLLLCGARGQAEGPVPETEAMRARVDGIIAKMTLEEKIDYIGGTGFAVRAVPRLGLPAFEMSDGPFGTRSNAGFPSTTYAAGIGLAATWNRELAEKVGAGIGRDARARGVHYMLGPGVNIYRSPRNGRNFEYFGEDPFLSAAMTTGYITGMQREGVSATVKHFMGNNSEFLRHDSDSVIDERTLREIYLQPFEAAVRRAHVGAIMDSYNLTNGLHMTQNGYFNTEVARKEWGFNGVMMSDWDATYDGVAAANGALDLEMPRGRYMNQKSLLPAVKSGQVSEATIDEKVRRILLTAARFGWLDRDQRDSTISAYDAKNEAVALQSARESMVLLKNEGGVLPLDKARTKSVLVVGPDAYPGVPVGGGSAGVRPFHTVSLLEGLGAQMGSSGAVYYERGVPTLMQLVRETEFTTEPSGGQPGVKLEVFGNRDFSGAPLASTIVRSIDGMAFNEESLSASPALAELRRNQRADGSGRIIADVARRWTGYYVVPAAGRYLMALQGGGEGSPSRAFVDDKLVMDDWTLVRAIQPHVTMELTAGPHKIVVEDTQRSLAGGRTKLGIVAEEKVVSAKVKEMAAKADAVIVSVGYDSDSESEGGDRTFELPFGQAELIGAMAAANKKTIVAVTSGGNVASAEWIDKVPAYIEAWYGGQEGGKALAEVLFGEVNPSGKLPATFEAKAEDNPTFANYYPQGDSIKVDYKEGIFVGYRGYEHNHVKPLYPFGYGLSYTTFKFSKLAVAADGAKATVSFDVTNTGKRAGAEVAEVYVSDDHAKVTRPAKELRGFEKVTLAPGETKHVSVALDDRAFAYYDVDAKTWKIEPGRFGILVGDSSEAPELKGSVDISPAAASAGAF